MQVYCLVQRSRIDLTILPDFLNHLNSLPCRRCILVSSTVVYGSRERRVDADSEVEPDSERAERQYRIEQLWRSHLANAHIVRLAGLYGPGRVIGRQTIRNGEAVRGNADAWLNLVHVDDAASLVKQIASSDGAAEVELGCDGTPVKRKDYYGFLAESLNGPSPSFSGHGDRGRRCDNRLTIERTGWQPRYTDYRQAISAILKEE